MGDKVKGPKKVSSGFSRDVTAPAARLLPTKTLRECYENARPVLLGLIGCRPAPRLVPRRKQKKTFLGSYHTVPFRFVFSFF